MTALLLGVALVAAFLVARWLKQTVLRGAAPPTLEGVPLVGGVVKFARVRMGGEMRGTERSLSLFFTPSRAAGEMLLQALGRREPVRGQARTHARREREPSGDGREAATRGAAASLSLSLSCPASDRPSLPPAFAACLASRISDLAACVAVHAGARPREQEGARCSDPFSCRSRPHPPSQPLRPLSPFPSLSPIRAP